MSKNRLASFNYAVGMFGTSIPINMLKTYATIYYVGRMGLNFRDWSSILLIYTFIDAIDNPMNFRKKFFLPQSAEATR